MEDDHFIYIKLTRDDELALKYLFDKYYQPLYQLAFFYNNDMNVSQEIIQVVFVTLWENRKNIIIKTSLKHYLYKMVKNKCLSYIRDKKDFLQLAEDDYSIKELHFTENLLEIKELEEIISKGIQSLPEKCKRIFLLKRERSLSYKEIANSLKISEKTVENQMGIALKKLHQFLKTNYDLG